MSDARGAFETEETFGEEGGLIRYLIVATKTYATVPTLKPLRHHLSNEITVLVLQNSMGISIRSMPTLRRQIYSRLIKDGIEGTTEEVTDALFANSSRRPHFLAGIVSHGVYKNGPFSVVHAGMGNITLGGVQPSHETETASAGTVFAGGPSKYLLHCLSAAPILSASIVLPAKMLQIQLEKLAINASINPLTVILDCLNGELFTRPPHPRVDPSAPGRDLVRSSVHYCSVRFGAGRKPLG